MKHNHSSNKSHQKKDQIKKDQILILQNNKKDTKQTKSETPKKSPYPPHKENDPPKSKRANPAHPFPYIPPITPYVSPKEEAQVKEAYKEPTTSTAPRNIPSQVRHIKLPVTYARIQTPSDCRDANKNVTP